MQKTFGMEDRVVVDIHNNIADVRLNRPHRANALDLAMFEAIVAAGDFLQSQPALRVAVLSGEGETFCAGLDVGLFKGLASGEIPEFLRNLGHRTHGEANLPQQAALIWQKLPFPVIAAISGAAFGGGLQIALAADIRVVAPDASLSVMELRWGIIPDMAGMVLMRDLTRTDVLRELTYSGRLFNGEEAVALGLATRASENPKAVAMTLAKEIASRNPDAVRAAKRIISISDAAIRSEILLAESQEQDKLIGSKNQIEAVVANVAKRAPVFS